MALEVVTPYETVARFDVVICGGGPAGVAAALASATRGAKTLLVEQGGCLGGFWTRGLLTWLIDTEEKEGMLPNVLDRLEAQADGRRLQRPRRFTADTEKTKLVFEQLCREAGVEILYHTSLCGAVTEAGQVRYVLTHSKSGHVAYSAKYFVDTTGDGDLGYYAGASYCVGNEAGVTQPMSLVGQVGGVTLEDIEPFDSRRSRGTKAAMLSEMEAAGVAPSYKAPLLAVLSEKNSTYGFMVNHEYGNGLTAQSLTQATLEGRQELHDLTDALRARGGIWKDLHLTATADYIGVREGRRIRGLYTVTAEDVAAGRQFPDGICTVRFGSDIHSLTPGETAFHLKNDSHPPYTVPYRCLVAAELSNLLMGGRCISGDFLAHGSYRVAGNAFRTGEVAGLAAAHCALTGISPAELDIHTIL